MNNVKNMLARRYAEAFLQVFSDNITVNDLDCFKQASIFLKQRPHGMFLMELSLVPEEAKHRSLDDFSKRFNLPHGCKKLCFLLIKRQRISLLSDIFNYIVVFKEQELRITHFDVSSSSELSDAQQEQIVAVLDNRVQGSINCTYRVDTSLVAGIRLQSASLLWEKSVKKRLRALQESLR